MEGRGVLYLSDGLAGPPGGLRLQLRMGEALLPQAQQALWELRRHCGWVCVAADGAAGLALALAAQLPVDRVALVGSRIFERRRNAPREMLRMNRFARRNLALVAAEVLLIDPADADLSGMLAMLGRGRVCALESGAPVQQAWQRCAQALREDWAALEEGGLPIPGKCV